MNYQIRIRTDADWEQLDYISDWITEAGSGFCFEHKVPGNHHYHVYLFDLDRNGDAMRRHLGKHLPSKECYAVSTTCGKKKKRPVEPNGAYIYGTTYRLINHTWFKGFTNAEMEEFRQAAIVFHGQSGTTNEPKQDVEKAVKVPYQQAVISDATADWWNYKRDVKEKGEKPDPKMVIDFVCKAMRTHGRGINPYLVKELAYAVLHDDLEFVERILNKIKYEFGI